MPASHKPGTVVLPVVLVLREQRREDQELKVIFGYKSEFKVRLGYVSPCPKNKLVKISLIQLYFSGIGTLTVSCPVTTVGHSELFSSSLKNCPSTLTASVVLTQPGTAITVASYFQHL